MQSFGTSASVPFYQLPTTLSPLSLSHSFDLSQNIHASAIIAAQIKQVRCRQLHCSTSFGFFMQSLCLPHNSFPAATAVNYLNHVAHGTTASPFCCFAPTIINCINIGQSISSCRPASFTRPALLGLFASGSATHLAWLRQVQH